MSIQASQNYQIDIGQNGKEQSLKQISFPASSTLFFLLNEQIEDMRNLMEKSDNQVKYGMPYSIPKKSLINLTPNVFG